MQNGALKGFAPTDQLAQTLHLESLKEMPLKDIKTSFSFRKGWVRRRLAGKGDTTAAVDGQDTRKKLESTGKGLLNGLLNKKKSN